MKSLMFFGLLKAPVWAQDEVMSRLPVVRLFTSIASSAPEVNDPKVASNSCAELTLDWGTDGEGGLGTFENPSYAAVSGGTFNLEHSYCGQMLAILSKEKDSYVYLQLSAFERTSSQDLEIGSILCGMVDEAGTCEDTNAYFLPELDGRYTYTSGANPTVDGDEIVKCEDFQETDWSEPGTGVDMENAKNAIISGNDSTFCGLVYIFGGQYYQIKGLYTEDAMAYDTVIVDLGSCEAACGEPCLGDACRSDTIYPMFGGDPEAPTDKPEETEPTEPTVPTDEPEVTTRTTTEEEEEEDSSSFAVLGISILALFA